MQLKMSSAKWRLFCPGEVKSWASFHIWAIYLNADAQGIWTHYWEVIMMTSSNGSIWTFVQVMACRLFGLQAAALTDVGAPEPYEDVIKWKYFPRYWTLVRKIYRSPLDSPLKGQWPGTLMFSLISAWKNGWANNRDTGDLRRHHAHYNVTVMKIQFQFDRNSNLFVEEKLFENVTWKCSAFL